MPNTRLSNTSIIYNADIDSMAIYRTCQLPIRVTSFSLESIGIKYSRYDGEEALEQGSTSNQRASFVLQPQKNVDTLKILTMSKKGLPNRSC